MFPPKLRCRRRRIAKQQRLVLQATHKIIINNHRQRPTRRPVTFFRNVRRHIYIPSIIAYRLATIVFPLNYYQRNEQAPHYTNTILKSVYIYICICIVVYGSK